MTTRILVAYASRYGSTMEVAEAIGDVLGERGPDIEVDVLTAKEVTAAGVDVASYGMVVVGSPVYAGKWLGDATEFVKKHAAALQAVPVAIFSVGLTLKEDTPENRATMAEATKGITDIISPVATGMFAGKLDTKVLSLPMRMIIKAMKSPEGDFRNWDTIREWAEGLPLPAA